MGKFVVSMTLALLFTIIKCFLRLASEVRDSNPVIGKIILNLFADKCVEKTKKKKKWPGMAHFYKINYIFSLAT